MRRFRALALGAVSTLALGAAAASAADYLRGSQVDSPPPQVWGQQQMSSGLDWSGFYFGAHGGWSRTFFDPGTSLQTLAGQPMRQSSLLTEFNPPSWIQVRTGEDSGANFGAMAGYNMTFGDTMIGFEADYSRINQSYSGNDFIARRVVTSNGDVNDVTLTSNQGIRLADYITGRVRFGWSYGRYMPFATFGGAVGRFDMNSSVLVDWRFQPGGVGAFVNAAGFPTTVGTNRRNVYGFGMTAGAGVDVLLAENIFLRAEYQFVRFGDVKGATIDVNTIRAAAGVKF